jgi:hypothetical protein
MATRLYRHYGQGRLVSPGLESEKTLLRAAKKYVLEQFPAGKRRQKSDVAAVLQCYFNLYSLQLDSVLKKISSREFMEFVLHQYDVAAAAWRQTADEVSLEVCKETSKLSVIRRGLKHLAERIAMRSSLPEFAPAGTPQLFRYAEEALFYSRMLADLYLTGDTAYYLYPGDAELELLDSDTVIDGISWPLPFRLNFDDANLKNDVYFNTRVARDRSHRSKYFPDQSMNLDFQRQSELLEPFFETSFGCPFSRFLHVIAALNEQAKPAFDSYPVCFFHRDALVRDLVRGLHFDSDELPRRILGGFTLTRQQMMDEQRVIFQPNQEHRAFRRGYFEFPHTTGTHLVWSNAMASEGVDHLVNGICFKKLPEEWVTPETSLGLDKVSNEAGIWFEKQVNANLLNLGIQGHSRKGRIVGNGATIDIPSEVGQLDFLGFSKKDSALVVVESKMVEVGFESRFFRNEISQFTSGKNSFVAQLRRKIDWVVKNRKALGKILGSVDSELSILPALITLYPTYAAFKIHEMPCVSLVELMEDYTSKGSWPYSIPSVS